ncbi:hypothetical protein I79_016813 [Cricetulus griseus]|uniref:Uncharacterized protein n=1 Tax=Cricetulus griseus TaxID=10029 RepID=G3I0D4_CRIGR|nr:hypothetical protein I79_016813 [Cricetulus griseus]
MPQTMIPLKNYYGRTVQTADSKFRFACYLYSIDGVPSLPTPMSTHYTFILNMKSVLM